MTQPLTGSPTFQVRPATQSDIREIAQVWRDSFPGQRTVGERIRMLEAGGQYGGVESVIVAAEPDGTIVGACKVYRMDEYIAGVSMPMMGLAAVAVIPSRRRRGLGARLCVRAIDAAAERGDLISVLYPFRPDYYKRLGWGLVGALHEYRFHTEALETHPDARFVRSADLQRDAGAMAACYRRVAEGSNGPIERDRQVWAYRFSDEELGVLALDAEAVWTGRAETDVRAVVYDDGEITGYALVRYVQNDTPEEHTLEIRELAAETDAAYRGLLGHIASQNDQWPLCHYFARPDENFGDFLSDPRPPRYKGARALYFPTARIVRGPMLRLLDVPGALAERRYFETGASRQATFSVSVSDEQRPENDGPWILRLDGEGTTEVESLAEARENGRGADIDAGLETRPDTLARIFAGEISASRAARQGRATIEGNGPLLDRAFATRERFWLMDEF